MPTSSSVPEVDKPKGKTEEHQTRFEELEYKNLELDAKAKEHRNREASLNYRVRIIAAFITVFLILSMLVLLIQVVCRSLRSNGMLDTSSIHIAVYVAPIASFTTLALSLLVAAFRGNPGMDDRSLLSEIKRLLRNADFRQ